MQAPGGLYLEGRFSGRFFCVTGLGGLYLEGLIHGGAYFRNFTVGQLHDDVILLQLPESNSLLFSCTN